MWIGKEHKLTHHLGLPLWAHHQKTKVSIPITLFELFLRFHFTWFVSNLNVTHLEKKKKVLCRHSLCSGSPLPHIVCHPFPPWLAEFLISPFFSTSCGLLRCQSKRLEPLTHRTIKSKMCRKFNMTIKYCPNAN